jgi:ribosomal protein S18 acetylase RimI-like enzyme
MSALKSSKVNSQEGEILPKGNIQISYAKLEDVGALTALHYKCFTEEDHIAMKFGKAFIVSAYKWFVTSPKTFVLIATQEAELVGFTAVSEDPYNGPMLRAGWREALASVALRPWLAFDQELIRRFVRSLLGRKKDIENNKVAQIAFTGVDPQFQGMGIGKVLKKASIRACRERGMKAIITGVKVQNSRARAMNESAGFVEVPELRTKKFVYLKLDLDEDGSGSSV